MISLLNQMVTVIDENLKVVMKGEIEKSLLDLFKNVVTQE